MSYPIKRKTIKNVVIIFSKVPVPGTVKTRLIRGSTLDADGAASLAEAMLKDTIALSAETNATEIVIGFAPASEREFIERIVGDVVKDRRVESPITFLPQSGTSFDERFGSVVAAAFATGADNLVILGGDLPYLPPDIIDQAFSFLMEDATNNSIVLGPAGEGGIYLVGITRNFDPELFSQNQLFSGGIELSQFIRLCAHKGRALKLLPAFTDIDVEEDLVSLVLYIDALKIAQTFQGFHFPSYTADAITQLELVVSDHQDGTRRRRIGINRA